MIDKFLSLKGRHVLITGSTRGIGFALAKGFIDAGCQVWIHGKKEPDCIHTANILGTQWISGDLEKKEDIFKIAQTIKKSNKLDILINNAGIELHNEIENLDFSVHQKTMDTNLNSIIILTHELIPLLKQSQKGNILNITSIHQEVPYKGNLSYCISKAALSMFTKCIALELSPYNIRVNNLAPGAVRTNINKDLVDSLNNEFKQWIPLGHVAKEEEIVGSALYFCSDLSSYTTGTTLFVDGGYKENLLRYTNWL